MKKWILGAAAAALLPIFAQADQPRDEFFWLSEINKASCIINTEEGLLEKTMGERIAKGISAVITNGNKENGPRPKQVIKYEPYLIKEVGMDATMLHIGRSSQDMHATYRTAIIRDNTLKLSETLTNAMEVLNTLAKNNQATIVPNYTNGVAAQPNSYALSSSLLARSGKNPQLLSAPQLLCDGHHRSERDELAVGSSAHGRLSGFRRTCTQCLRCRSDEVRG